MLGRGKTVFDNGNAADNAENLLKALDDSNITMTEAFIPECLHDCMDERLTVLSMDHQMNSHKKHHCSGEKPISKVLCVPPTDCEARLPAKE